uniref:proteasome endopeptidase complex n=1 Tax=Riptortus pedestris TaxID=329032 RepID=R4WHY1_RIPPE|nr:proteasome subunit beta type 6,9 [Riptortus pedestris]
MALACYAPCDKYGAPSFLNEEISTGTSIMACVYRGGVIVGADSRTSSGAYISNRVSDKLTKITDNIYCCRSGSAADTQAVADIVAYHLAFQKAETGEEPNVATAAAVFQELCYTHREQLTAGIIVAGYDKIKGGQVYSIPLGGMCVERKCATGGSGSTYVYGYVDSNYRDDMTEEEVKKFVVNTIALAMHRDGSSGGVIRIALIDGNGPVRTEIFAADRIPQF